MNGSRNQLVQVAALASVALVGWFFSASALTFGFVLGVGVAPFAFGGMRQWPARIAIGLALGFGLFAALLFWVIRGELVYAGLGDTTARVMGVLYGVCGLMVGMALRFLWQALSPPREG